MSWSTYGKKHSTMSRQQEATVVADEHTEYDWQTEARNHEGYERFIGDTTGFDRGDKFNNEQEVRAYFSESVMRDIFGYEWDESRLTQRDLDEMADMVIENRWWMEDGE